MTTFTVQTDSFRFDEFFLKNICVENCPIFNVFVDAIFAQFFRQCEYWTRIERNSTMRVSVSVKF